ncbi:Y-family DNA polymerase [Agrobacterium rosae]|uniref:DNA polymerase Y family protein n=1 Tax=Agrobacterium rosae TaxID=1972867 RepID=A0AAW9FJY4_9HYPH|nr:DNA polymerase Y family protein [Agrobacterium rosae]MDX8305734.1 DNA polymerase Y family protein [Agrobacterium rosae]
MDSQGGLSSFAILFAQKIGVRVGMAAAKAQAIFRGLMLIDADPGADAAALDRIALRALGHYSPIVAVDGKDGLVLDTEGADHLIVPRGEIVRAIKKLPISLLRLPEKVVQDLRVLSFHSIAELSNTPRAPLALRFGPEVGRRLDQMFGRAGEPIDPIRTADLVEVSRSFQEPIGAADTINKYVGRLVVQLVAELEKRGLGARRTDLIVHRVDNTLQAIRAGTAKPARDVTWLTKLFKDRTEQIDPGFGIEKLVLVAVSAEPLQEEQKASSLVEEEITDLTPLIDIFSNRGGQRVYRVAPVASDVPERSVQQISAIAEDVAESWVGHWRRPVRLFERPEQIQAIAMMPDYPPATITWRGKRHRVKRADGPERIFGELRRRGYASIRDDHPVDGQANTFLPETLAGR